MKLVNGLSEAAHRQAVRDFIEQLVRMKHRAGELELWRTMHALDDATTAVGYEAAGVDYPSDD